MQHELPIAPAQAWTDGALKKGRYGGWAALVLRDTREEVLHGQEDESSSNRMELSAVIAAIRSVEPGARVHIVSDSQYVVYGATRWMEKWARNGWRKPTGDKIPNRRLWIELHGLYHSRRVSMSWVRGHDGHPMNERADALAQAAAQDLQEGRVHAV